MRPSTPIVRFVRRLCLAAAFASFGAPCAQAVPDPKAERFDGWKLTSYEVKNLPHGTGGAAGELALSPKTHGLVFKTYPAFSSDDHQQDRERLRLYLARHGYPWAKISSTYHAKVKDRSVAVTLEVDPGPATRIARNVTEAFPPSLEPKARSVLRSEEGEVFSDAKVHEREGKLLDILTGAGYARAQIATQLHPVEGDSTRVAVTYVVDAGSIYDFGRTIVGGIRSDLKDVVNQTISIDPGARYDPAALDRAAQALRLLDLFRKVRVITQPARGDTLDVLADLAERSPRGITVSAGYWTGDQLSAQAQWKHRNLFKAGRGLGIDGQYSKFLQEAGLSVWKPALFHTRFNGVTSLTGRREAEPNYTLRTLEMGVSGTYVPSVSVVVAPSVTVSLIDFQKVAEASGTFVNPGPSLLTTSLAWTDDTLDNELNPSHGTFLTVAPEYGMPSFRTRQDYVRIQPEGVYYLRIVSGLVLASRLRFGYVLPMRRSVDLLPNKRFYAGGANSVRGFERRRLGPRDANGDPLGGVASVESSLELDFPLFWILTGAVFADGGQVWAERSAIDLGSLEYAAGPGIGVRTPVGPIRADLGIRLGRVPPDELRTVFSLSIGRAL